MVRFKVLWLWLATALAQVEQWQSHMDAGVKAYQQGNYPEAEKEFVAAAKGVFVRRLPWCARGNAIGEFRDCGAAAIGDHPAGPGVTRSDWRDPWN